jgi:GTP-binding protein
MPAFDHAAFMRATARAADFPPPGPPEIAFAGRSNVGKSSAINALTGRRSLARTSKTPGRTQTINFYSLGEEARELVTAYLRSAVVVGVVVLMDARHPMTPLDRQLIEWLGDAPQLWLFSKADKLSRNEQARLAREMNCEHAMLFSSVTRQGVEEARDLLERWLQAGREK